MLRTLKILCLCLNGFTVAANNIQVTDVRLTDQNSVDNFTLVEFDISWENSWRLAGGPANWDAAWVFVKYRVGSGNWQHAWINNTGHSAPAGSTIAVGLLDPGAPFHNMTNPGMGVFIHRSAPGSGTFTLANVKLRWNYGDNGLDDDAQLDIKVFAIEHVYVPQGAFRLGDGGTGAGQFFDGTPENGNPTYLVSSEALIDVSPMGLYYELGYGDQNGPIPGAFPKGYNDFYVMKYELSQQGYADYLNTLTRTQQQTNIFSSFNDSNIAFVLANSTTPTARNGVRVPPGFLNYVGPAYFFCDLNNDQGPDDEDDGRDVPCNYIKFSFYTAYLDWAGLRPMTELEFEKACRGPVNPVLGEYAWGNTEARPRSGFANEGKANELPANAFANASLQFVPTLPAQIRCGAFATAGSDRVKAGAGYWGVLELSGNLREYTIAVGSPAGRAFTGAHGNGTLTASGYADVSNWPDNLMPAGAGVRGGFFQSTIEAAVSNRTNANAIPPMGNTTYGLRGVRTAPN